MFLILKVVGFEGGSYKFPIEKLTRKRADMSVFQIRLFETGESFACDSAQSVLEGMARLGRRGGVRPNDLAPAARPFAYWRAPRG